MKDLIYNGDINDIKECESVDYLLSPKMDFIFKQLFGMEENKEILISFLNSVLDEKVKDVELKNTDLEKEFLTDKFSRLDIKAITDKNYVINIEIQVRNENNMIQRTLYYWSKIYENQLANADKYSLLNKTICINILDFKYLKEEYFHNVFRIKNIKTNKELTDILEIHFIELSKLNNNKEKDLLVAWCDFLNNPSMEITDISDEVKPIKLAKDKLIKISSNEDQRELYERRLKILRDEYSSLELAEEKGRKEEKNQIAMKMLESNIDINVISNVTSLTIDEILLLK